MSETVNVISTLGFPIAVCIALGWFIDKIISEYSQDNKDREKAIMSEMSKINDTNGELVQSNKEVVRTNSLLVEEMTKKLSGIDMKLDDLRDEIRR
ncbi:MAG: hypothetical protein GX053_12325 [Tissierella sp.]|nr:hypothetical protein [Tissierella sp.]